MRKLNAMVKKFLILLVLLSVCVLTSCDNSFEFECDHCGNVKKVSYQLVDGIDLVLCDECYKDYLQGEWNLKTNRNK